MLHWLLFTLFILAMLALDLGVFNRKSHSISTREALKWSAFWIALAFCFNGLLFFWKGHDAALQFFTAYLVEKSLSVDNIFVIWMVFATFCVQAKYQHRVLFWGIIGAMIMRAIFILAGISLINHFHGILYIFGAFLVFTGIRMALHQEVEVHPENNFVLKLANRWLRVTKEYVGGKFFSRIDGKLFATPLFLVLLVVETTDLIFAVDSIPAVLAISHDPFIVFTSNVFAILGLRSLYFALAGLVQQFRYLHLGLAAILVFVGVKMIIADFYKIPITTALLVIAVVLIASVIGSLLNPLKELPAEVVEQIEEYCMDDVSAKIL